LIGVAGIIAQQLRIGVREVPFLRKTAMLRYRYEREIWPEGLFRSRFILNLTDSL
jgi:hypothetical protein